MSTSFRLPPESPVEHNRNIQQVSYLLCERASRTCRISGRLRARASSLRRESQALRGHGSLGAPRGICASLL
jgi:hypothetical protein